MTDRAYIIMQKMAAMLTALLIVAITALRFQGQETPPEFVVTLSTLLGYLAGNKVAETRKDRSGGDG